MGNGGREAEEQITKELLEFARRFRQVMSEETGEIESLSRSRYWQYVQALSRLERVLDSGDGREPVDLSSVLSAMRVVLEGFAGRRVESEPYRRAASVEERRWYVQWGDFQGYRKVDE